MKRTIMLLSLLAIVLAALAGTAAAQAGPGAPLVGDLSVIIIDPPDPTMPPSEKFYLTTAGGATVELAIDPAARTMALYRLSGQRVAVETTGDVAATQSPGVALPVAGVRGLAASPNPTPSGNTRWLTIACKFPDVAGEPKPLSYLRDMYSVARPGLDHYWREASYGAVNLVGSTAVGWYTMPHPLSHYSLGTEEPANFPLLFADCVAQADPDVYLPDYYGFNLVFNGQPGCCAAASVISGNFDGVSRAYGSTFLPPYAYQQLSVVHHEMTHAYGILWHTMTHNYDYGDPWDVVSWHRYGCENAIDPVYGCLGQHTSAYHRDLLGWVPPARKVIAGPGTTTLTLQRSNQPPASGPLLAIVPIDGDSDHFFVVEARQKIGYDSKLPADAVVIYRVDTTTHTSVTLVDPSERPLGDNPTATWLPGESYAGAVSPAYGVLIRIDAATATGFTVTIFNGNVRHATKALTPTQDAYVQENRPSTNYGAAAVLNVDGRIPGSLTMLDFDAAQLPTGIYYAKLRLTLAADPAGATPGGILFSYPGCRRSEFWSEATLIGSDIIWGNCRQRTDFLSLAQREGNWVEYVVTTETFRYGVKDYALLHSSGLMSYSSKEGATPPQLVVDYLAPLQTTTTTFTPTNDAYVLSSKKTAVFNQPRLQVRDTTADSNSYLKFNVNGLSGAVSSATLRLWVLDGGPDGGRVYATSPFYKNTSTQWLETGLKWNNAPAIAGAPLGSLGAVTPGGWVTMDVTAAVSGNGRVSLALSNDSTNLIAYSSKEGGHAPQLVVVTE